MGSIFATIAISAERNERISRECMKQYGINTNELVERIRNGTLTMDEATEEVPPERYGCIVACYLKKQLGDKKSIKKHITDSLNEAETKYTKAEMDEIRDTVEICTIKSNE